MEATIDLGINLHGGHSRKYFTSRTIIECFSATKELNLQGSEVKSGPKKHLKHFMNSFFWLSCPFMLYEMHK